MTRRSLVSILLVLVILVSAAGGTAAATTNPPLHSTPADSFVTSFVDGNNTAFTAASAAAGVVDRYAYSASAHLHNITSKVSDLIGTSSTSTTKSSTLAAGDAHSVQTFFNAHSTEFVNYANNRTNASADYRVFKITFERSGTRSTKYVVASMNNTTSKYTSAEMVNSTSKPVDQTIALKGYASANALKELEYFHKTYVTANEPASKSYLARLYGRYHTDIKTSFLNTSGATA